MDRNRVWEMYAFVYRHVQTRIEARSNNHPMLLKTGFDKYCFRVISG
jgi:hypothetical protein